MSDLPRISFGTIVLNGEPFTKYCLRSLYPFAYEIIVVEGGSQYAKTYAPDGHSTDGTLEALYEFKKQEDPENKVRIITKDGFWEEKEEQSQAYAEVATGDYLWQVDNDEFYKPEDMKKVIKMLGDNPEITQVSLKEIFFWGGFDYVMNGWKERGGGEIRQRLFKWGPGYRLITHRPPTVHNSNGENLRNLNYVSGYELARKGIFQYHYSLVFPRLVREKCQYHYSHSNIKKYKDVKNWAQDGFMNLKYPYNVDEYKDPTSWLERFRGEHPEIILRLQDDIRKGIVNVEVRRTDDIEALVSSPGYIAGRMRLKFLLFEKRYKNILQQLIRKILGRKGINILKSTRRILLSLLCLPYE